MTGGEVAAGGRSRGEVSSLTPLSSALTIIPSAISVIEEMVLQFKSPVPSDIDVAQAAELEPISTVAAGLGLEDDEWITWGGKHQAKVRWLFSSLTPAAQIIPAAAWRPCQGAWKPIRARHGMGRSLRAEAGAGAHVAGLPCPCRSAWVCGKGWHTCQMASTLLWRASPLRRW